VKKGEYVFLNINGDIENFLNLLLEEIQKVGAFPIIKRTNAKQLEEEINSIDEEKALDLLIKDLPLIENSDVYISLLADRPIVISPANLSK
jgi:leucyl aminopeptidase (aminopeptidase T)